MDTPREAYEYQQRSRRARALGHARDWRRTELQRGCEGGCDRYQHALETDF